MVRRGSGKGVWRRGEKFAEFVCAEHKMCMARGEWLGGAPSGSAEVWRTQHASVQYISHLYKYSIGLEDTARLSNSARRSGR